MHYNAKFLLTLSFLSSALALPIGGLVTEGEAQIIYDGARLTVEQSSNTSNISWESFNITRYETVHFQLPRADSVAHNNITGNASTIAGTISSNGHIYLSNPAGITFTDSAKIDVPSLFVNSETFSSEANITTQQFSVESGHINLGGLVRAQADYGNAKVILDGDTIEIGGIIDASGQFVGGEVKVSANDTLKLTGEIKAEGEHGGLVALGSPLYVINGSVSVQGKENGWIYSGQNTDFVRRLEHPLSGVRPAGLYYFETVDGGDSFFTPNFDSPSFFSATEAIIYSEENRYLFNDVHWEGEEQLDSFSNHYTEDILVEHNPHFSKVRSKDVFDNTDVVFYYNQRGELEHDLVVRPGAEIGQIRWKLDGAKISKDGDLVKSGFAQKAPFVYQDEGTYKNILEANYTKEVDGFGISVKGYDNTKNMIIDPVTKVLGYYRTANFVDSSLGNTVFQLNNESNDVLFILSGGNLPTLDPGKNFYIPASPLGTNKITLAVMDKEMTTVRYATSVDTGWIDSGYADSDSENFYVALYTNKALTVPASTLTGSFNSTFNGSRSTALMSFKYDGTLNKVGYIGSNGTVKPSDILVAGNNIYVSSLSNTDGITGYVNGVYPFTTSEMDVSDVDVISRLPKTLDSIITRAIVSNDSQSIVALAKDFNNKINIAFSSTEGYFLNNGSVSSNDGTFNGGIGTTLMQIEPDAAMTPRWAHSFTRDPGAGQDIVRPYSIAVDGLNNIIVTGHLFGYQTGSPNFFVTNGATNIGTSGDSIYFRSYTNNGQLLTSGRINGDQNAVRPPTLTHSRSAPRLIISKLFGSYPSVLEDNIELIVGLNVPETLPTTLFRLSKDYKTVEEGFEMQIAGNSHVHASKDRLYVTGIHQRDRTLSNPTGLIPGFMQGSSGGGFVNRSFIALFDFEEEFYWGITTEIIVPSSNKTVLSTSTLPNSILTIVITQKDGSQTVTKQVQSVNLTKETVPVTLNDALVRNNLSKTDIRDVSIDDGNGVWVYENGTWRYKRR